jgi:hypothetical protein
MTIATCQLCFCLKRGCAEDPIYSIITLRNKNGVASKI